MLHALLVAAALALPRHALFGGVLANKPAGLTVLRVLPGSAAAAAGGRPSVLIVWGIGCFTIDDATNEQNPYLRLAHDLSRKGFVTMRLEKSGVGDSQGPPCATVDFASEEHSYAVALAALAGDPHVDPKHAYVFGHSIGTVVAPRLAATGGVAGIVVAEAVGRDWFEYELRNARRQLELGGASPADVDAAMNDKYVCMYRLLVQREPEAAIEAARAGCREANGAYPVDAAYVAQVAALTIVAAWTRTRVPVLAIYGTSDFVTERADHERIVAVVNARPGGAATLVVIDGMDHNLLRAATPKAALDAFERQLPGRYDTDLSAAILTWLCSRERCE